MEKKRILVLGGGFAGLVFTKNLLKKRDLSVSLAMINKHDYFLFTPNLYEAATSEEELVSQAEMVANTTLGIPNVLGKSVNFISSEVLNIDLDTHQVKVSGQKLGYDYLVMAFGSETEYFGIPGAEGNTIPLKNLVDALRIRKSIEFAIQAARSDLKKSILRIAIVGGGYTGVEFAGELAGLINFLAWKNQYPREKIDLVLVEAGNTLIPGLDDNLSADAAIRLKKLGVRILTNYSVAKVEPNFLEFKNGERLHAEVMVWAAGIKASRAPILQNLDTDPKGRLKVTQYLNLQKYPEVFCLGDKACVVDLGGHQSPQTAQDAIAQAKYLAEVFPVYLKNIQPQGYSCKSHGYIVAIGGQWAILKQGHWYIRGPLAYWIQQYAHMRFLAILVGWWQAFMLTFAQVRIFSRND